MNKEEYLKAIDDIRFKIYLFKKYLNRYPYDTTGIIIKDRYACMLKNLISEYEIIFSEKKDYEEWEEKSYERISDT